VGKKDFVCREAVGYPHSVILAKAGRGIQSLLYDLCAVTAGLDARLRGHDGLARYLRRGVLTIFESR
jgi:hypothetical protein